MISDVHIVPDDHISFGIRVALDPTGFFPEIGERIGADPILSMLASKEDDDLR
jgi:hypothetical protein